MARIKYEGRTKIHWVTTVADQAAPTAAEISAGVDLTPFVTKDGYQPNATNNTIDTGGIDDDFNSQIQGSYGADFSLVCMRDDTADTAFTTLVRLAQGFIVVGLDSAGGIAATDVVEVWPAELGTPNMANSGQDTLQTFTVNAAVASPPTLDAVVAA